MHKKSTVFVSALFLGALATQAQTPPSVAVLGAENQPGWNQDVVNLLAGTGGFSSVTGYDVATNTPSLATLQQYSSVLVYSDSGFFNATTLGNELATYADEGHGVVVAVFATFPSYALGGLYASEGYEALSGSYTAGAATLGTVEQPNSPIMAGITSFDGGSSSYRSSGGLINNATLIASWSDGTPLVAETYVNGNYHVDLNMFPVSSDERSDFWQVGTDGTQLMANALGFTGGFAVPEPTTLALAGLGGVALLFRTRK